MLITGDDLSNTLTGTDGDDTINGLGGADKIVGGSGNDVIDGGADADSVSGGDGDDIIMVGRADNIHGDAGDDTLLFNGGTEITGASTLVNGDIGTDTLHLNFSACVDSLTSFNGGAGSGSVANVSWSGIERVEIIGGSASDTLSGGADADTLNGGGGNDRLDGRAGANVFIGGTGRDIALIDLTTSTDALALVFVGNRNADFGGSTFTGIESLGIKAGSSGDSIDVSKEKGSSELYGQGGNDVLVGLNDFKDTLDGGDGNDSITFGRSDVVKGGAGNDVFYFSEQDPTGVSTVISGDADYDVLRLNFGRAFDSITSSLGALGSGTVEGISYSGIEALSIVGGTASDTLVGSIGNDTLIGGTGNDRLVGGSGGNQLDGGDGRDIGVIDLSATTDALNVQFRTGKFDVAGSHFANIEALGFTGGSGDDIVNVSRATGVSEIFGGAGNDTLTGSNAWLDTLDGGDGNDLINFYRSDSVRGGTGDDTFQFAQAASTGAPTTVNGETGDDLLVVDFHGALDKIVSSNNNFGTGGIAGIVFSNVERLLVTAGDGGDSLAGGQGDDTISGGAGNDTIFGGSNGDVLTGGTGADVLTGYLEGDTFRYVTLDDSTVDAAGRDLITDFTGEDKVDLSALDADAGHKGNQAFTFLGTGEFTHHAGELRAATEGANTLLLADTDGDGVADFSVAFTGQITFDPGALVL